MKYDNPIVRDVIDECIRKIMGKPDEEFLKYANTESRWVMRLASELYNALTPANCFGGLATLVEYLREKGGHDISYESPRYCTLFLSNTAWSFSVEEEKYDAKCTTILSTSDGKWVVEYDSLFPAGTILAIDFHYPYILEKARALVRETERRRNGKK